MMFTRSTLLAVLAATGIASAIPANTTYGPLDIKRSHANRAASLHKRIPGRATWYDVGLGACGRRNVPSDFIVALNDKQYGSGYPGPHCFERITIRYQGKTAVAEIRDMCPGCPYGALDMSKSLFQYFEPLGTGVFYMEWEYGANGGGGGGGGGGNNNNDDDDRDRDNNDNDRDNDRGGDRNNDDDERTSERRDPPRTSTTRSRTRTRTSTRASRTSRSSSSRPTSSAASTTVIAIAAGPTTSRRPRGGNIGQQQQLIANLGLMAAAGRSG